MCGAEGGGERMLLREAVVWWGGSTHGSGHRCKGGCDQLVPGRRERKCLMAMQHIGPSSILLVAPVKDFLKTTFASEPEACQKWSAWLRHFRGC